MKDSNVDPKRIKRIQSVEQSQLDVLVTEFARMTSVVQRIETEIQGLQEDRIDTPQSTLATLTQSNAWNDHVDEQLVVLLQQLQEMQAEREAVFRQLMEKKIALKGWEHLLDRHQTAEAQDREATEIQESDERFLQQDRD